MLVLLAAATLVRAAEIDSFTDRNATLTDSTRALERRLNASLASGVERANRSPSVCNEEALYAELRHALASPFIGHVLTESLNGDDALDRRLILRADSIYRDLDLLDNISVHWKDLSAVVRVGDVLTGVDKFGHFFVEGWSYFETANLDGEGIAAAMDWGERSEETYFGFYTTGVRSSADLVADFDGMRFWRRVLGAADDPLKARWRSNRPYVRCKRRFLIAGKRRWKQVRKFDLDDYVTPAWDEAVNCCAYRNPEIESLVQARIAELGQADGVDHMCPIDPGACAKARQRYGPWARRLLHERCFAAQAPEHPGWQFWR
jgi:hypothetical protein